MKSEPSQFPVAKEWQRDSVVRGLRTNGRSWVLRYRARDGTARSMSIGLVSECDVEEARRLAASYRKQIREGRDPLMDRRARADLGPTLGQLIDNYISSRERTAREHTIKSYRWLRSLVPDLEGQPARTLTSPMFRRLLDGLAVPTGNRLISLLRASYTYGLERGLVLANPAVLVKKRKELPRDRALTDADVHKLLEVLREDYDRNPLPSRRYIALGIRLLLGTACRVREVLDGTFDEIAFTVGRDGVGGVNVVGVWTVPARRRKVKTDHNVYLTPDLCQLIADTHKVQPENLPLLKGRVLPEVSVASRDKWMVGLTALTGKKGVSPWMLRDLRRTWATCAASLSISQEVIDLVLGHLPQTLGGRVYTRHGRVTERIAAIRQVWDHWNI